MLARVNINKKNLINIKIETYYKPKYLKAL